MNNNTTSSIHSSFRRKLRLRFRAINKLTHNLFSRSYFKAIVILNIIALINFYSVANKKEFYSQLFVFCFGSCIAIIISNLQYEQIKKAVIPFYISICFLIGMVSLVGVRVNGARRWLRIGSFTLQPTELIKLGLILIIALYLEYRQKPNTRKSREYNLFDLVVPLTLTLFPLILILKQPDLGTTIICLIITGSILFFMGIERKTLIIISCLLFSTGLFGWKHLKPYQKDRVVNFLSPEVDYRGKSWQAHQSLIAFGSGGLWGKGIRNGAEVQLGFLPEKETDFALASLGEEHGFVSIIIILGLIYFIVMKFLFIARNCRDRFSAIVSIGIAFWIASQAIINTGMVIGKLPIVGIPFPIISYGGSSLLSCLLSVGIMTNIEKRKNI